MVEDTRESNSRWYCQSSNWFCGGPLKAIRNDMNGYVDTHTRQVMSVGFAANREHIKTLSQQLFPPPPAKYPVERQKLLSQTTSAL